MISKLKKKILNNFYSINDVCSVSIVGSFSNNEDINNVGDIDIVVIFNKLDRNKFNSCIKKTSKVKNLLSKYTDRIFKINSTFGPIKFDKERFIVIHLMIYDVDSHIDHVTKSPFTCYDWELSNIYVGKKLSDIYPVRTLQLNDFINSRRSIDNYLDNLNKSVINYKKYILNKNNKKIKTRNFYFKIDNINRLKYYNHIIFFLIINFLKFINKKNYTPTFKEIINIYKLITGRTMKKNIEFSKKDVLTFLKKFESYLNNKINKINHISISRHKKTKINNKIFLGTGLNPSIQNTYIPKEFKNKKFDTIFTSNLKRAIQSASLVSNNNKIISTNLLNEIDYGKIEGKDIKYLDSNFPNIIKNWKMKKDVSFPMGENYHDVELRIKKFFKKNKTKIVNSSKTLIVTHNVIIRIIVGSAFLIPKYDWFKLNLQYFKIYDFIFLNGKLLPNIDRKELKKIFKNV